MRQYDLKKFYPLILIFVFWFLKPPEELDINGYRVFIVFVSVIFSILLQSIPTAVSVLTGLTFSVLTGLMPLKSALKGYSDSTTWLVVIAFLIAGAIINSGLGNRISLLSIYYLGRSITGLGYAICCAELILGPVVPSNTARGGGILAPIVDSISKTLGSSPSNNPRKAGQYLNLVGAHANLITAAMFLTGMAANPLVSRAALEVFEIEFGWLKWALGAIVPGLIGLAGLPLLMKYLSPPSIESIEPVRIRINKELQTLGSWTRAEIITGIIMVLMVFLWLSKSFHGFGTTIVALSGLMLILFFKVVSWDNMVKNHKAWDTLIWLGGLLTIATSLKEAGFIFWFSGILENSLLDFSPILITLSLALIYFYSMYLFSMLTAHIVALSGAMFLIVHNLGFEPIIIICLIAYFSNLSGCLTNYSTGPMIIYFGNGYVMPSAWFKIGFIVSIYHIVVWLGIGSIWWKFLGWW